MQIEQFVSPKVFWITGLSGSGKTTLANILKTWLDHSNKSSILIDGDEIREMIFDNSSFDAKSRLNIAKFNSKLCKFLANQNQIVICCTISLFKEIHIWNRLNIPGYLEIFLDAPISTLYERDSKGLYRAYREKKIHNLVGLDITAEFPKNPDIHIKVTDKMTVEKCGNEVKKSINKIFKNG